MKKNKLLAFVVAVSLILGNTSVYAESGKVSVKKTENKKIVTYQNDNHIALKEKANFIKGLEREGRDTLYLTINGFQLYEDYFPNEEWFYTEENGTLMTPLMGISEMMGAVFANKDEKSVKFEKNGKAFVFEKDSDHYVVGKEKKPLRHPIVEKNKVLYIPLYDLLDAYEMLIYIDRNPLRINFNKDRLSKYPPYEVQVIIWDKEMQLFKKDNPELQQIVHAGAWTAKYNKLFHQENRTDYVLLDTKSRYRFQLLAKDEDGKTGFTTKNPYLEGLISPVPKDGIIKTQFLYTTLYNGQSLWFHEENQFKTTDGNPYPFTVKYADLEEAELLAFHTYRNNIMTVVLNPFFKEKKGAE